MVQLFDLRPREMCNIVGTFESGLGNLFMQMLRFPHSMRKESNLRVKPMFNNCLNSVPSHVEHIFYATFLQLRQLYIFYALEIAPNAHVDKEFGLCTPT